jgi:pimeloyl-ACP methyl ester carboxylesterase
VHSRFQVAFSLLCFIAHGACGSEQGSPAHDEVSDAGSSDAPSIDIPCNDTIASIYGDPGELPAEKGAILRCARDADLSAEDIQKQLPEYEGKPFTSSAHVYRVLYRTERGDGANTPATSVATVFVPTVPRAEKLPVIVVSHGTRGQGPECATSKLQEIYQTGPLVGAGYAVIAPDLSGFNNYGAAHNPPSIYAGSADVAKSTLDGAKALRKVMGHALSDKVVLLGHSQGGHTTLSALAMASEYDAGGTIAGVFVYAPLWISQATWGALPLVSTQYPFKDATLINAAAIWYMYTHGEALDGPGHGGDIFKPEKRAAIKDFQDNVCLDEAAAPLQALGTDINDLYDPSFTNAVSAAVGVGAPCDSDLCKKWAARFSADRPHLTGSALEVPIQIAYGGSDTAIPPERMACVLERLENDGASYSLCMAPGADHPGVVYKRADFANDWIAARTLGAPEPPPCKGAFERPACATPPAND